MPSDPSFRMTIEDVFSIRGLGTVVTGRIERGRLTVGDTVDINQPNLVRRTVVIRVELFRRQVQQADVGDYVGVVLEDVEKDDVQRGDGLVGAR